MSTYIAIFKTKQNGYEYKSPMMFIDADSQAQATEKAQNSALGRFKEWKCHVSVFFKKERVNRMTKNVKNPNSKSQLGKSVAGHGHANSRPVRRALRRQMMGAYPQGCKQTHKFKCW